MTNPAAPVFDDLIIGSGMAGLTVASLLARSGRRVLVLEAHEFPGGYAHTFKMGHYRFCAQVHYIFGCGKGEQVDRLLEDLGLREEVKFVSLDPDGYDHVVIGKDRYRIPLGWTRFKNQMLKDFPDSTEPLKRYFDTISKLSDELDRLPGKTKIADVLSAPFRFPTLIRYRNKTLSDLYEQVKMPPRLRAILAGQCGDYLLPPSQVSLLLHTALVMGYGKGAYYPEKHYSHLIDSIVGSIKNTPGCEVLLEHEVERILVENGSVSGVVVKGGKTLRADRYISNIDPSRTFELAGIENFPKKFVQKKDYSYSYGTLTLYIGIRNLDLRNYGFGSFNIWHYPDEDLDRIYADQGVRGDISNPWLFMSTPTLHTNEPGLCPPDRQILEIATHCRYEDFRELRDTDKSAYNREKRRLREIILDVVEKNYIPELRKNMDLCVMGTPATNERYCWAPRGNSYGAALTPKQVQAGRRPFRSPLKNLWLVNATAGFPSIGGTVSAGRALFNTL
jgi:all-trans-retinol 13,14-reductase